MWHPSAGMQWVQKPFVCKQDKTWASITSRQRGHAQDYFYHTLSVLGIWMPPFTSLGVAPSILPTVSQASAYIAFGCVNALCHQHAALVVVKGPQSTRSSFDSLVELELHPKHKFRAGRRGTHFPFYITIPCAANSQTMLCLRKSVYPFLSVGTRIWNRMGIICQTAEMDLTRSRLWLVN